MHQHQRRVFLHRAAAGGLLLTPLSLLLAGCSKSAWPEGMVEIKWDRDTCARCSMVISDRRFAAEVCGSSDSSRTFKFDDIGCLLFWLRDKAQTHPWMSEEGTRLWVADAGNAGENLTWRDPRAAHYITKTSPMGYNFGAVATAQAGSMDFESMRQHILAKGK